MENKNFNIVSLIIGGMFLLVPLIIRDTASAMNSLLVIMPVGVFLLSMISGMKFGRSLIFSLLVGLMFLATVYIHYNSSALVYVLFYLLISLVGNSLGSRYGKRG